MKFFIFLLFLLSLNEVSLAAIKTMAVTKAADAASFFPYSENILTISNFPESTLGKGKSFFSLPVSYLTIYGFKAGTKIQSVDLIKGLKHEYLLKETVNVMYYPNQMENFGKGKLHIILSDKPSVIENYSNSSSYSFLVLGFSYIGSTREIFPAKERFIPTIELNEKFVFENRRWDPKEKGVELRSVKLFDKQLIVRAQNGSFGIILKDQTDFFGLRNSYTILTDDFKFLKVAKWGKDTEVLFLQESTDMDACYDLYFISKSSASHVPLPCSKGSR